MAVRSWEHDLWWELADDRWVTEHRSILVRLDVECRALTDAEPLDGYWEGAASPAAAQAAGRRRRRRSRAEPLAQCSAA